MEKVLISDKACLRAIEPAVVDNIYRWENDTTYWDLGCSTAPYSKKQILNYIENNSSDIYTDRELRLIIEADGTAVGIIDLINFDLFNSRAAIGILIDKDKQGLGYGEVACNMVIDYARNFLGIHQLYVEIPTHNTKSINLFKKLGFIQTGIMKDWQKTGNTFADIAILQLIF